MEKPRHRTIITSDIRQQILSVNRKAREELEKKLAETEKLLKPTDVSIHFSNSLPLDVDFAFLFFIFLGKKSLNLLYLNYLVCSQRVVLLEMETKRRMKTV